MQIGKRGNQNMNLSLIINLAQNFLNLFLLKGFSFNNKQCVYQFIRINNNK